MARVSLYKRGPRWWVGFTDHTGEYRRISAADSKPVAKSFEANIYRLREHAAAGVELPQDLADWAVNKLDKKRRAKLVAWKMLDERRITSSKSLQKHVDDWRDYLETENQAHYALTNHTRMSKMIQGVATFSLLTGDFLARKIKGLTKTQSTRNAYINCAKMFCRWMVDHDRASKMPAGVGLLRRVAVTEPEIERRCLTDAEIDLLLKAPEHRRIPYALALFAGLRRSEIMRLRVRDIVLEGAPFLAVMGKNKKLESVPINSQLAGILAPVVEQYDPGAKPFHCTHGMAGWVRKDCGAVDDPMVDFHALRHTFISRLARAGVHPKTAQKLARHSTIQMTMKYYTHMALNDDRLGVEAITQTGASNERLQGKAN